ncbi:hypothetical protein CN233_14385 [Sinorhizobium meliloti]|nr:hypothetical protein CN233_14385 [Sinorhizobium meliloti]RVK98260.1 hypothetical protein CN152_16630 [Sinorhizobium meliloti]RVN45166.1 hypothetical protein CN113_18980 [Sinorhizobium meliloti]RVO52705.1 hypothetical protein CN092_22260 [Sinorhizobium meliloti]
MRRCWERISRLQSLYCIEGSTCCHYGYGHRRLFAPDGGRRGAAVRCAPSSSRFPHLGTKY